MSTDLRAACEYLEDMGVCLSEDFRAAAVSDGIAIVKPIGKSLGEAAFCEDMSLLEPEEKRLLSSGNGAVISSDIPDCVQTPQRQRKPSHFSRDWTKACFL